MIVEVKVSPGSGAILEKDGILLVHTMEKRENNRANLDVIRQIAAYYSIETSRVRLVRGRTSRKKTFIVDLEKNGD